jgi:hypothetical protein
MKLLFTSLLKWLLTVIKYQYTCCKFERKLNHNTSTICSRPSSIAPTSAGRNDHCLLLTKLVIVHVCLLPTTTELLIQLLLPIIPPLRLSLYLRVQDHILSRLILIVKTNSRCEPVTESNFVYLIDSASHSQGPLFAT